MYLGAPGGDGSGRLHAGKKLPPGGRDQSERRHEQAEDRRVPGDCGHSGQGAGYDRKQEGTG